MRRAQTGRRAAPFLLVLLSAAALPGAAQAQSRIVAAGGDLTEIIYDLGAESRLVGVDSTSTYPAAAKTLPDIGYLRRLSAEPILALHPDLLLATGDAGPAAVLDQVKNAGLRSVVLQEQPGMPGVLDKIRVLGRLLGKQAEGDRLAAQVKGAEAALATRLAGVTDHPRVLVLLSGGRGSLLAAGEGTAGAAIVTLAGGQNAVTGFTGYKPLTPEIVAQAAPDAILVPSFALAAMGGREGLGAMPDLAGSPAAQSGRVIVMDGLLLLGFGPRTPEAAGQLAAALHPDLASLR